MMTWKLRLFMIATTLATLIAFAIAAGADDWG